MQDFKEIQQNPMDERWTPRYVEVNFNNACNLKCSYCSPQFSTTWGKEVERYGQYPTTPPHNAPEHFQGRTRQKPNRADNTYVTECLLNTSQRQRDQRGCGWAAWGFK